VHEPVRVRTGVLVGAVLTVVALVTACTAPAARNNPSDDMPGMGVPVPSLSPTPTLAAAAPGGTGLAAAVGGYTFVPAAATVPAGTPGGFNFQLTGPDGHAVTRYQPYLSKLLLCYVIRADLTGFRYVDAAMRQDGVWIAQLPALTAGSYRMYVTFATPDAAQGTPLVYDLSRPFTVTGPAAAFTPDAPAVNAGAAATVDGYTVTLGGSAMSGQQAPLTVTVTKAGNPVESLDRYLDGYAQVSAFHEGDLARASIHSIGGIGRGGVVTTQATFPEGGTWRVYAQFQVGGAVHTAAFTMAVPG
jgi:hypothetical protein